MRTTVRVLNLLEKVFRIMTAAMIGLLTLFVSWEAFARFVLHSGQFWAQEASLIAMTWIGLLGAAAAVWSDGHISLTLVVDRLSPTGQRILRAFADLAVAAFALVLFFTGLTLVQSTMDGTWSSIPVRIGTTNIIVPATAAIMFAFSFVRFVRRVFDASGAESKQEG
ncbi:MAG TPA: TRAP transporter small permease [Spirochaetia bacterium]|nr:TRAP transporter small permease [Spirochaetia bacterium]